MYKLSIILIILQTIIQIIQANNTIVYSNLQTCETECIQQINGCKSSCKSQVEQKFTDFSNCQDFQEQLNNNPGLENDMTEESAAMYLDCYYQAYFDTYEYYVYNVFGCSFNCIDQKLEDLGYEDSYYKYKDSTYGQKPKDYLKISDSSQCISDCKNTFGQQGKAFVYVPDCLEYTYLQENLEKGEDQEISQNYFSEQETYFLEQCYSKNAQRYRYYSSNNEINQLNCYADCHQNDYDWDNVYQYLTLNSQFSNNYKAMFPVEDCKVECYNDNNCDQNCISNIFINNNYSNCKNQQNQSYLDQYDNNLQLGYYSENYIKYNAKCISDNLNGSNQYNTAQKNSLVCLITDCLGESYQPVQSGGNNNNNNDDDDNDDNGNTNNSDNDDDNNNNDDDNNDNGNQDDSGQIYQETELDSENQSSGIKSLSQQYDPKLGQRSEDFIQLINLQQECNEKCYQDCNQQCQNTINLNYVENSACQLFESQTIQDNNNDVTSRNYISLKSADYYSSCLQNNIPNFSQNSQPYLSIQCEYECVETNIQEAKKEKGLYIEITECPGDLCYEEITSCLNQCEYHICENLSCLQTSMTNDWVRQLEQYSCDSDFANYVLELDSQGLKSDFSEVTIQYQESLGNCISQLLENTKQEDLQTLYDCSYGCTRLPETKSEDSSLMKFQLSMFMIISIFAVSLLYI